MMGNVLIIKLQILLLAQKQKKSLSSNTALYKVYKLDILN